MADPRTREALVDQGTPWAMAGSPPPHRQTFSWGDRSHGGTREGQTLVAALVGAAEERALVGAAEERTLGGALGRRGL